MWISVSSISIDEDIWSLRKYFETLQRFTQPEMVSQMILSALTSGLEKPRHVRERRLEVKERQINWMEMAAFKLCFPDPHRFELLYSLLTFIFECPETSQYKVM